MSDSPRTRSQATMLGWGVGTLLIACLLTLWSTYSLVTYDLGDQASTYFRVSFVGVAAVALCVAAVRLFFRSPGAGSRQLSVGTWLLIAGAVLTVGGICWLLIS